MPFGIFRNTKSYTLGNYTEQEPPKQFAAVINTNIGVSENPLFNLDGGTYNTHIGVNSEIPITINSATTLVGYQAAGRDNSVIIGAFSDSSGNGNTFIGKGVTQGAEAENQTAIGFNAQASGVANSIQLGNADINSLTCNSALVATSDIRVKENIQDNNLGLEFISRLRPVTYTKKNPQDYPVEILEKRFTRDENRADRPADNLRVYDGLIAQEVEETLKDLDVNWSGHNISIDSKQGIEYSTLTIPLINCIKTLKTQIEELTERIEQLEN